MTVEERLKRMEAQAAIADLVNGYALAIRRDRPEDVEPLFAPQGSFEVRQGAPDRDEFTVVQHFPDPQALVGFLLQGKGGPHPIPMIHNLIVTVTGETAVATSVMVGPIAGTEHQVMGEYADRFTKIAGEWRFAARAFTIFRSPA